MNLKRKLNLLEKLKEEQERLEREFKRQEEERFKSFDEQNLTILSHF